MENKLCRIAVFYDGTYFHKVSNYYNHAHKRKARLSFKGLHEFIVSEVAKSEGVDRRHCQIVDAAYFRGRLTAQQAQDHEKLYTDRFFEDILMKANVTMFQRHLRLRSDGSFEEKGIDVWLALEAYEMASLKKYDVCVLVSGDGDFVPLVNKLNTLGSRVMLIGWDFCHEWAGKTHVTQVSTELIDRVNYPIMMNVEIDADERRNDPLINGMFIPKPVRLPEADRPTTTQVETAEAQKVGRVLNVCSEKGFGFIEPFDGGDNCYFRIKDVSGIEQNDIREGLKVVFLEGSNDRGHTATGIRRHTE